MVEDAESAEFEAGGDVSLEAGADGPSGLITKVSGAAVGADRFHGYEIAVGPGRVRLGKHKNDFTLLRDVAWPVPTEEWVSLRVEASAASTTVYVNGERVLTHTDDDPLVSGAVGLRQWGGPARFRNLWRKTGGRVRRVAFARPLDAVSGMWRVTRTGTATGTCGIETNRPSKGRQCQTITFISGDGEFGVENRGLNRWGMYLRANRRYEGYVWVRAHNFCEAAGVLGIPTLHYQESPEDLADFVEYVNGPTDSEWGARRAADGHPEPYRLRHLQLGNEEAVDSRYFEAFKPAAEAIWAGDADIILVVGDFAYNRVIEDPYDFEGAPRIRSLEAHRRILDLARAHGREVWFDVHLWVETPPQPTELPALRSLHDWLGRLSPGARYKLVCFEFNADRHDLNRALANAHAINELQRVGEQVGIAASANCLQPDGQKDNGWDQGLLFFNPETVWAQPPYDVTRMASEHHQPVVCPGEVPDRFDPLVDVAATRSEDAKAHVIQAVNMSDRPEEVGFAFDRFNPEGCPLSITTSKENPSRRTPQHSRSGITCGPMMTCPDSQCTSRLAKVPATDAGCRVIVMSSRIS